MSHITMRARRLKRRSSDPLLTQVIKNESPESPPPGSPSPVPPRQIPVEQPSPGWELPDDGNILLNCFTRQDVVDLKNWALKTSGRIKKEGYVKEALIVSQTFVRYLLENLGPQWKIEFLRPAAGPQFERMIAYGVGYARLTSYNKQLLRGLYETWHVEERAE